MVERIDHVNIVVSDLEAMTAFYRDLLGMRVAKRITIRGDWIQTITGFREVEADVTYLEADPGAGLELIRYRTPQGPRPTGLDAPNALGIRHVAFRVEDLDAVVASVKAKGLDLLSEVERVPTGQVDFEGRQKRIVYCRDPEGNLLELCAFE
ncbi:MAG: VOC family protein [Planctomycetota bacterium]|jgi:catechol 2,3-dioxygenase-like lactoylglutathione lyase family enzyme